MNNKVDLEQIINNMEDLPTLPHVVTRIIQLTQDPNTKTKDIEKEILKDQTLTAKVLKLANSAFYNYPRKISTISQATVLLGFDTIKSITITASVGNMLNKELAGYALEKDALLNQSKICAMVCSLIAKKVKFKQGENAYVAGLLRDIGKLILNQYMKDQYHEVVKKVEEENYTFVEAEDYILGFNHAVVGSKIAEKWNLPLELVDAIENHHNPDKSYENKELTAIVHIADCIIMMMGVDLGIDGLKYYYSPLALELLKLKETDIEQILSDVIELLDENKMSI